MKLARSHKVALISLIFALNSCTLSFTNISTHGTATDLVDTEQAPDNTLDATITPTGL